jgi:hypothetical protein
MEDGGWLEKYNDGGPIQPNYNDYSVSAGPGFEGDGYSNVGRNYSPAWGGQFKDGGGVRATKQDSLDLYNNAKKVLDYYNSKKYNKTRESYYPIPDSDYNKDIHNKNLKTFKEFVHFNKPGFAPPRVPLKSNSSANVVIPESMYYKKLDDNKYMQRESANAILDTRAPMQLFDKRIAPSVYRGFINKDINDIMEGDAVSLYGYDPILVKPESMLTPQERALRIKRYGEYSGIPNAKPKSQRALDKSETSFMEEYSKKYPPIYVSDSKDPRIGKYAPKGNQYLYKKPKQSVISQKPQPTPQSTIDFMEGNYAQEPITEIPQASAYGEVVDPRTGYTHMTRQGSAMYPMVGQNVPEMEEGGPVKRFMQPTETFKNYGYNPKTNGMSTELSTSIGGPGEVYLVPGYRQGKILQDPEGVFNAYGEHLGGPFKTVQAAEDFGKLRHQYVEQNKNIPAPFKTRDYAMGGSLPGSVGFMYARTNDPAPSNGKYAKKTKASAQDGTMLPNQDASTYIKIPSKQEIDILKSAKSDIINEGNSTNRLRMLKNAVRHDMASEQFKTLEEINEVDLNKRTLELANKKQQNLNNPRVEFISGNGISKNDVLGYFNPTNSDGVITLSNNINNINELKETSRHEYRHAYDDAGKLLTNYEKQFIGSKTAEGDVDKIKAIGRDQYKYLTNPTEITARLQEIRGGLKDAKVYDASKDKATLEHLNSAKNISGYQDLLQVMKPEDIVDLLNTIATNSPKQGMPAAKNGKKVIKDDRGQWDHPGEITEIGSNQITMQGVPYPVMGISDTGDMQMMYPNQDYVYDGESVTEIPMMAQGGQLTKLDQLTNFTNYNTKQPGGWLDKYES